MNINLYRTDTICVDYFYQDLVDNLKGLAFVFSPSYNRVLDGNNFGGDFLLKNGWDVVAFKISNDDWFQQVPESLFDKINEVTSTRNYIKRIGYGSSMGGYAAISFSKFLQLDLALVFSPQYSISENFDTRWQSEAKRIQWKYKITPETVSKECVFYCFYDDKNLDKEHIKKLEETIHKDKFISKAISYSGHPVTYFFAELDLLKPLLLQVIESNRIDGINFKQRKSQSKSYLFSLAVYLANKNKVKFSLFSVERAIQIDSKNAQFHRHKSAMLNRLGRLDDAIQAAQDAVTANEKDHHALANLSFLLANKGAFDEALTVIERAIQIDSKNSQFIRHKSLMLSRLGRLDDAIQSAQDAITANDRDHHSFANLSFLLANKGDFDEALTVIERAIQIDSKNSQFIRHKSLMLSRLGRLDDAIQSARDAISVNEKDPHSTQHLNFLLANK